MEFSRTAQAAALCTGIFVAGACSNETAEPLDTVAIAEGITGYTTIRPGESSYILTINDETHPDLTDQLKQLDKI
jgi:hypothetical protein